jgi:hypothetical protein
MSRRSLFVAVALALGGCHPSSVALSLLVDPACIDPASVATVRFTITSSPPTSYMGQGQSSFTVDGRAFFATPGTSNRRVLVFPGNVKRVDVLVEALGSRGQLIGIGEDAEDNQTLVTSTLRLGNAQCSGSSVDGGLESGHDAGFVGDLEGPGSGDLAPPPGSDLAPLPDMSRPSITLVSHTSWQNTIDNSYSLTLTLSQAPQDHDVILAVVQVQNAGIYNTAVDAVITPPSAASWKHTIVKHNSAGSSSHFFVHVAAGEVASFRFSVNAPFTSGAAMAVFRNVNPTTPIANMTNSDFSSESLPVPAPNAGAVPSVAVLLLGHQINGSARWAPWLGLNSIDDVGEAAIFQQPVTMTGPVPTGTLTVTENNATDSAQTELVVLNPQ